MCEVCFYLSSSPPSYFFFRFPLIFDARFRSVARRMELRHANYFAEPTHFLFSTTKQLGPEDNPGSGAANGL